MIWLRWPFGIWIVVAAGAFAVAPALAAHDEPVVSPPELVDSRLLSGMFPPDPEGYWRRIDATESTSKCIGDPVTPLCAIETLNACLVRRDDELCDIARGKSDQSRIAHDTQGSRSAKRPKTEPFYRLYRVTKVRFATQKDIDVDPVRFGVRRPGDLLVDLHLRICTHQFGDHTCDDYDESIRYTLRRVGSRWQYIHNFYGPRNGKFIRLD